MEPVPPRASPSASLTAPAARSFSKPIVRVPLRTRGWCCCCAPDVDEEDAAAGSYRYNSFIDSSVARAPPPTLPPPAADDFEVLALLGRGSYGRVLQVRKRDTRGLYAMKVMRKADVLKRNHVRHALTERRVLQTVPHPFIVPLHFAFQSGTSLYLVMALQPGGDVFFHRARAPRTRRPAASARRSAHGAPAASPSRAPRAPAVRRDGAFAEARARLYAAEITLGVEALHSAGFVYRDLKPENVLLDARGHVRLSDFGLAKETSNADAEAFEAAARTQTFCGTPSYMAPEMLLGTGHGVAVDWWSLGTLLYEMLCGAPPFYSRNLNTMYRSILYSDPHWPKALGRPARSLLAALLHRDPHRRLGSKPGPRGGAAELRRASFFRSLDFGRVLSKAYAPLFVPHLVGASPSVQALDTNNFDATFTDTPIRARHAEPEGPGEPTGLAGSSGTEPLDSCGLPLILALAGESGAETAAEAAAVAGAEAGAPAAAQPGGGQAGAPGSAPPPSPATRAAARTAAVRAPEGASPAAPDMFPDHGVVGGDVFDSWGAYRCDEL